MDHWMGSLISWGGWLCCAIIGAVAALCSHLWSSEATGCVPWEGGTDRWALQLGGAVQGSWFERCLRLCSLTGWCHWLRSMLGGVQAVLCKQVGRQAIPRSWARPHAGLHNHVDLSLPSIVQQGPHKGRWLGSLVGRVSTCT